MGTITIKDIDMISVENEYMLKKRLQRRGMPFVGVISMELDIENYTYTREYDVKNKKTTWTWEKIESD